MKEKATIIQGRQSISRIVVKDNSALFSDEELEAIESARATGDIERLSVNLDEMMADEEFR